ncbi:ATP-binding cassette domain-containing protein [Microbacterium sediminicola]|uniref:ATP-binding cassette domain-containing protein n=1 Tax=Microbacterium sediminicola TaxID=415210 RepID=A0ABP4UAL6_9MICO
MLQLTEVTKSYGDRRALDEVSFAVADGRLTGFVGGNGAGKTTTMRIVLGVLAKDSGSVTLHGAPVAAADRRRFGYMPEERGLYPKMKVREHIVYLAKLHGFSHTDATRRATALLERLGLGERMNDMVEALSLGNQQRAQIAAALVHEPEVLILDEPFSGLDPLAVDVVAGVLHERAAAGAAVLFSSHQLDVVERLCDDLVIIAGGTIRASGSRDALRAEHASHRYELSTATATEWIGSLPGITVATGATDGVSFDAETPDAAQAVLREALARGPVSRFTRVQPTLADIFREVIR